MPTPIPVDFRFKRGTKDGLNHLPIDNGSLNFTVDTEEFYVDIDDKRLTISSVEFYNTEADIKALTNPGDKIFVAKNTRRILAFDPITEQWIYLSSSGLMLGACDTLGNVKDKVATVAGDFVLEAGAVVVIKYTNTNTYNATTSDSITLNVNETGAKNIYYGDTSTPTGTSPVAFGEANVLIEYMFDGTYWVWMGASKDRNTVYQEMGEAEAKEGIGTTAKVLSAKTLNAAIENKSWEGSLADYNLIPVKDPSVAYYIR